MRAPWSCAARCWISASGLWHSEPAAKAYGVTLRERGKPGAIIAVALGRRANKIAFAMVRDQAPYDPRHWTDPQE